MAQRVDLALPLIEKRAFGIGIWMIIVRRTAMHTGNDREELRKIYQRSDNSEKTYLPAKPKINPNERDRLFKACAYQNQEDYLGFDT